MSHVAQKTIPLFLASASSWGTADRRSSEDAPPLPPKPTHLVPKSPSEASSLARPGTAPVASASSPPLGFKRPATSASLRPDASTSTGKPALPPRHPISRAAVSEDGRLAQPRPTTQRAGSATLSSSGAKLGALASRVASNAKEQGAAWGKRGRERIAAMQNRAASAPPTTSAFQAPRRAGGVVFGRPLADVVRETRMRSDVDPDEPSTPSRLEAREHLPAICWRCLEYLDACHTEEGIYRIPGSASQVASLKALFDAGDEEDLRLRHPGEIDPHAVASVFKLWLRDLPESILTAELERPLDAVMLAHTSQPATSRNSLLHSPPPPSSLKTSPNDPSPALLSHLNALLVKLPRENWYLLREIATHLARLAEHSDKTRMTLDSLRLILSPTLRVSPAMLQILVERREILFAEDDASRFSLEKIDASLSSSISSPSDAASSVRGLGISEMTEKPVSLSPKASFSSLAKAGSETMATPTSSGGSSWIRISPPSSPKPPLSPPQIVEMQENLVTNALKRRVPSPLPLRPKTGDTIRPGAADSPLVSPTSQTPSLTSASTETAESVAPIDGAEVIRDSIDEQPPVEVVKVAETAPVIHGELETLDSFFGTLSLEQRKLFFES